MRLTQAIANSSEGASALAESLASLIGVQSEHLRHDDKLGDILRVHRDELPPDIQPLMQKVGLKDVFDPFAFALLDMVEKRIGQDRSRMDHPVFRPIPSNEAEWIERIRGMSVGEFLDALA